MIGVLALQGDVREHVCALGDVGAEARPVRRPSELDDYAPGLEASLIGQWCQSPKDLAKKSDRGNIVHADMSISQMGPLRPIRSMSGYKTPVGHLWHTAAGAHPMGALNGWSGRTTGRMVDRIMRRAPSRRTGSCG